MCQIFYPGRCGDPRCNAARSHRHLVDNNGRAIDLDLKCPNCGKAEARMDARFCSHCGWRMATMNAPCDHPGGVLVSKNR
jgi:hypothetical protein